MSCGSLKHRFERQMENGISFESAMEIYQDAEGPSPPIGRNWPNCKKTRAPSRILIT
jgi:hypothetical protein